MKSSSGNALFLILIAVALFAALSYAVTNSGRGGGGIDRENAQIAAAQIIQYAGQIEQAITRLNIISGCGDSDISFYYDSNADGTVQTDGTDVYYNANSPTPDNCHVFSQLGAGLTYTAPNGEWLDNSNSASAHYGEIYFTSSTCVPNVGSGDTSCDSSGSADEDVVMFIPYIQQAICENIVQTLDIAQPSGDIPIDQTSAWSNNAYFDGTFVNGRKLANTAGADTSGTLVGQRTGCFEGGGTVPASNTYHFYHVVMAR